jgi:hypothetical protein
LLLVRFCGRIHLPAHFFVAARRDLVRETYLEHARLQHSVVGNGRVTGRGKRYGKVEGALAVAISRNGTMMIDELACIPEKIASSVA